MMNKEKSLRKKSTQVRQTEIGTGALEQRASIIMLMDPS
jgi:hypothetical protein